MKFQYKSIPRGWDYPLSKKEIRAFLESCPGDVCLVEFTGLAWHGYGKWKKGDTWCAGEISVHGSEEGWKYKIELRGLPSELIELWSKELKPLLLTEMNKFVLEFEARKLDPLARTEDLRLFLYDREGEFEPSFSRWKIDGSFQVTEQRDPWWI